MDNILNNLPDKYIKNYNLVEINNKLTFGDININNLKLLGKYFNHLHLNNLHGKKINIAPIKSEGLFNIFQINNYNINFSFKVNHVHQKVNNDLTNSLFKKVKKLEKMMGNYQTGFHIKCYQNLRLENFDINSLFDGEQLIYFKDCIINENLTLNLAGRSMLILDNSSIHGIVKFNMKTNVIPRIKKNLSVKKGTTNIEHFLKLSENNNILFILGITLVIIVIILTFSKKNPNTNDVNNM